ncbi:MULTISPECIES: hypothetical protein [unclassified Spirosoma]|uniref:hypothetical protein n=1 Tax=unclassified Spirosoma TaxID=2621999 RepID=UPI000966F4E2|nr:MULTISPECIES: hypothetical protein [unclassified Spirosoma]MBN8820480.1 hypothetical protein [Spirosoma sp.]OJW72675.1 MAG: hypothetical protein BGO59_16305 [Spirosoma sp. 48-14]
METIQTLAEKYTHIRGWGIDADPKNDPTYPIKNRTDAEQRGYSWQRPTQQPIDTEVLRSIERPNVSAVFGTSVPPSGLSGQIRRFAFRFSESEYGHWLPLLLADRVNVVEGIIDDVRQGIVPNIFAEKGMLADWKYNRKNLLQQVLIGAVVTTTILTIMSRTKSPRRA